jgi:glycosyltransferase involved in cell wall biosynthesis
VAPLPDAPVFAAWGRHVPQKGFDLLLRAFALVRDAEPNAVLRLGGDGEQTPALRELSGPGVELVGPLDRDGVQSLLAGARVAVVPSRLEPVGIVAVEAMAAGRGGVGSTSGGLADATGGLGRGVDPTDVPALAGAMLAAHRDPVDPAVARAHAETLSWSRIAERYVRLYEAVR